MLRSLLRRTADARAERAARAGRPAPAQGTVDRADIDRFAQLAERWWDPDGPHGPLHRFVPVRMQVIRDALAPLAKGTTGRQVLAGLTVLDIGCGGGLLSEPMRRLGATVTVGDDLTVKTPMAVDLMVLVVGGYAAVKMFQAATTEKTQRSKDLLDAGVHKAQKKKNQGSRRRRPSGSSGTPSV